jgi:hypothetical protein
MALMTINILKMKKLQLIILATLVLSILSCGTETDDQSPTISLDLADAFPKNCDTIYLGETFTFKAEFTDNFELGAYSLDVHNNFNHHSHSTENTVCVLEPVKVAQNPWVYINQFSIPDGSKSFMANENIQVPSNIDPGDYHMYIKLTDKSGWQTIKGISIKILERK